MRYNPKISKRLRRLIIIGTITLSLLLCGPCLYSGIKEPTPTATPTKTPTPRGYRTTPRYTPTPRQYLLEL